MNVKRLFYILVLLVFALVVGCCSTAFAEQTYTVTESQLQKLEAESRLQKMLLIKLKNNEEVLKKQLQEAKIALTNQKQSLMKSQEALTAANESLKKYEQQEKKKQDKLTRQRTIWATVAGGLLCALIIK